MLIFLASLIPINIAEKPLAELLLDYTSSLDSPDAFNHEDKYPTGSAEQYNKYIYEYVCMCLCGIWIISIWEFLSFENGNTLWEQFSDIKFEVWMCMNKKRKHLIQELRIIYSRYGTGTWYWRLKKKKKKKTLIRQFYLVYEKTFVRKKRKKFLNRNCVIGKKNDKIVKEIFQTSTFNTQDHDSIFSLV